MIAEIIKDRDLFLDINKYPIYLIGASIKNSNGNGWQHKIARNFPYVANANKETNFDDPKKLGTCLVVPSQGDFPTFIYCYITKGRYRPDKVPDALDYNALQSCLELINSNFAGRDVGSTIIGNSPYEAGGDKERILEMIDKYSADVNFHLYDYEQTDYRYDDNIIYGTIFEMYKAGKITKEEYYEQKKVFLWQKVHGIFSKVPDLSCREIQRLLKKEREK